MTDDDEQWKAPPPSHTNIVSHIDVVFPQAPGPKIKLDARIHSGSCLEIGVGASEKPGYYMQSSEWIGDR